MQTKKIRRVTIVIPEDLWDTIKEKKNEDYPIGNFIVHLIRLGLEKQ